MSEQIQISLDAESDMLSQTVKLKVNYLQRAVQRAKDENSRLVQKMERVESENEKLRLQKQPLNEIITKITQQLKRKDREIQDLRQKLEIRTRRHQSELSQNISRTQKQQIQRRIQRAQQNAAIYKLEKQTQQEKCSNLLHQLQSQKKQRASLNAKIDYLQKQIIKDSQQITELQVLYQQKMSIIQKQKQELVKQNDSLTLQLKLLERRKQIEGLLDYQNKIGKDNTDLITNRTYGRQVLPQTSNQNCCAQLEQQLVQAEQLICLLKQRNTRLCSQLESVKKRCNVLQGIICSSST